MTPPESSARLSRDVVAKVARLARLDLTADELDVMTTQLAGMLDHFSDIDKLKLDDVVQPSLDRSEVLAVAPAAEDGRFRVPPTIGFQD